MSAFAAFGAGFIMGGVVVVVLAALMGRGEE
jgi:hypothetical protein